METSSGNGKARESSVLFSLHELRSIEERRLEDERLEVARREAEARARDAAARLAAEAERKRRAADEAARRRQLELEAARRAEAIELRHHEAEVRARAEAATRLEIERLRVEAARAGSASVPRRGGGAWLTLVMAGAIVVALLCVAGWRLSRSSDALRRKTEELHERQAKALAELEKLHRLQATPPPPPAAPGVVPEPIPTTTQPIAEPGHRPKPPRRPPPEKPPAATGIVGICAGSSDPLCGLDQTSSAGTPASSHRRRHR